ncbi:MAG: GNAT family N-acetyltransferase [Roseburia sp.]|nr:GNAT family N-acetyltransferase [Roseburia sp.]
MNIDAPRINQIPALRTLWQEAFGDTDNFLDNFFSTAFNPNRCRNVTMDGNVAAALYWFDCLYMDRPIAYIYAVSTAKAYRGQGICHELMKNTHEHLRKLGYEGAILLPGSESLFQFYESMGYRVCSYIRRFCCNCGTTGVTLRRIDKNEYATLRRRFLPEGGVIQEKENLDFLQTQTDFYAGSDFLLTACSEDDKFLGMELLGNADAAPKILYTLGYDEGCFRAPAGSLSNLPNPQCISEEVVPFTMYHPLGDSFLPLPTYFGLAFD